MSHDEQYIQTIIEEEGELREWLAEQQDEIESLDEAIDLLSSEGYHAVVELFGEEITNDITKFLASYVINLQIHKIIRSTLLENEGVSA